MRFPRANTAAILPSSYAADILGFDAPERSYARKVRAVLEEMERKV